jgi:hypothetical protein
MGNETTTLIPEADTGKVRVSRRRTRTHLVKNLTDGPSDFLVAIVRRNGPKVRLITAYCTNVRRKERRYRKFRKLALS